MPDGLLSVKDFAARVRSKYPDYEGVDDYVLTTRVLEKYPVYRGKVDFGEAQDAMNEMFVARDRMNVAGEKLIDAQRTSPLGRKLNPAVTELPTYFRPLTDTEREAQKRGDPVIISQAQSDPAAPVDLRPTAPPLVGNGLSANKVAEQPSIRPPAIVLPDPQTLPIVKEAIESTAIELPTATNDSPKPAVNKTVSTPQPRRAPSAEDILVRVAVRQPEKLAADLRWHFGVNDINDLYRLPAATRRKMIAMATIAARNDQRKKQQGIEVAPSLEYQNLMRSKVGLGANPTLIDPRIERTMPSRFSLSSEAKAKTDLDPASMVEEIASQQRAEASAREELKRRFQEDPKKFEAEYNAYLGLNRTTDSPQMREQFLNFKAKQVSALEGGGNVFGGGSAQRAVRRRDDEAARRQRVANMGWVQYLSQAPKSVALGFGDALGTTLKGIATLAKKLDFTGSYRQEGFRDRDGNLVTEGREMDTTELATNQLGQAISDAARTFTKSNKDLEQDFFVGQAPQTIGQVAQFMLGGWATKSPKIATVILGSAMTAGDAYDEIRGLGGSDDEAVNGALLAGGLLGPTELIGLRGAMKALEGTAKAATWRAAFKEALREGRRDIIENTLQEVGQEFGQGVITGSPRSLDQLFKAGVLGGFGGAVTAPLTLAANLPGQQIERVETETAKTQNNIPPSIQSTENPSKSEGLLDTLASPKISENITETITGQSQQSENRKIKSYGLDPASPDNQTTVPKVGETVSHPNANIDGKAVVATTQDGRVVVANEENKSGLSIVKPAVKPVEQEVQAPERIENSFSSRVIALDEEIPSDVLRIINRTFNQTVGPDIYSELPKKPTAQDVIQLLAEVGLSDEIIQQSSIELRKAGYSRIGDVLITEEGLRAAPKQLAEAKDQNKPGEKHPITGRRFSSTQVNLPADIADYQKQAAATIPDNELAADGREDTPHITVKYGLHTDDAAELTELLADEPPVKVKIGKVSIFPAKEGADYDVVKMDVYSPDLHRLNSKIAKALPVTDTHPEYKPHVTLAYVKPGEGAKYVGKTNALSGKSLTLDKILFSSKSGKEVEIPLRKVVEGEQQQSTGLISESAGDTEGQLPPAEGGPAPSPGKPTRTVKSGTYEARLENDVVNIYRRKYLVATGKLNDKGQVRGLTFASPELRDSKATRNAIKRVVKAYEKQYVFKPASEFQKTGHRQTVSRPNDTLWQFVQKRGGIAMAQTEVHRGELSRLASRISGKIGLLNRNNRFGNEPYTAEYMMNSANEAGYRNRDGEPFENIGDFIMAVADDASGLITSRSIEHVDDVDYETEYFKYLEEQKANADATERAEASADALITLLENEYSGHLYDLLESGRATEQQISEFTQLANDAGVSPEDIESIVFASRNRTAEAERVQDTPDRSEEAQSSEELADDFDFGPVESKPTTPTVTPPEQQLGFVSDTLTSEVVQPKNTVREQLEAEQRDSEDAGLRQLLGDSYEPLRALQGPDVDPGVQRIARHLESRARDAGEVPAELEDVLIALGKLAELRRTKTSVSDYMNQGSLFGSRELNPQQERILQALDRDALQVLDETMPATKPEEKQSSLLPEEETPKPRGGGGSALGDPDLGDVNPTVSPDPILSDADPELVHAMAVANVRMPVSVKAEPGFERSKVSASEVIKSYEAILQSVNRPTPIRTGRISQRDVRGIYKPDAEIIRLTTANNIPTSSHETGHGLQKVIFGSTQSKALIANSTVKRELVNLGKALYGSRRPAGGYRTEGFAEFIRYYLTRDDVKLVAPATNDWFESQVLPSQPEIAKALIAARAKTDAYRKQGAKARGKANTEKVPGAIARGWQKVTDAIQRVPKAWIDEFTPLFHLSELAASRKGPLGPSQDPAVIASALRATAGAKLSYMVNEGMIDFAGNVVGPPLKDATAIVRGRETDFALYLHAKRAQERWSKGKNPGMTLEDANALVADLETPQFELAAQKLYEWNDGILSYVQQAVPSMAEAIKKIRAESEFYIPLQRSFAPEEVKRSKRTGSLGGNSLKKMKGSGRAVKEIFPQILANAERMLSTAHKRSVLDAVVKLSEIEGLGFLVEEVPKDKVPVTITADQAADALRKLGYDIEESTQDEVVTFFTPSYFPKGQTPIVPLMRDGEMRWFQVDPEVYSTLAGMDLYRLHPLLDLVFGVPTRVFRMGVTGLRPAFSLLTNPLRDVQTFIMQTKSHKNPAHLAALWISEMARAFNPLRLKGHRDPFMDLFERLGAQVGQPLGIDIATTRRASKELFRGKVMNTVTNPLNLVRELLSLPESASRTAELRAIADEVGWKPGEPMTVDQSLQMTLAAKRVTTDFSAGGHLGKVVNQAVPFFNAGVQGGRSFARTVKDNPRRALIRGLLLITMPTLMLWWKNKDKEWYRDMLDRERFTYWNIQVGNQIIRIPKAFEWGNLFGVAPEAIFNSWYQKDPKGVKAAVSHIFETSTPDPYPVVAKVAKEQWQNRIEFFDRPIVPRGELDLPAGEQRGPYTSAVARWLGDKFPDTVSPRRVDHLIRGFGGGVAPDVLNFVGLGGQKGVRENELSDLPVIGRAFRAGGVQGTSSKAMESFYDALSLANARANSKARPETPAQRENRLLLEDANKAISVLRMIELETPTLSERQSIVRTSRIIAVTAQDLKLTPEQRVAKMEAVLGVRPDILQKVEEKVKAKKDEQSERRRELGQQKRAEFNLPGEGSGRGPKGPRPPAPPRPPSH